MWRTCIFIWGQRLRTSGDRLVVACFAAGARIMSQWCLLVPRSDEAAKMQQLARQSPDVLHVAYILRRHRHVHEFGIRMSGSLYDGHGRLPSEAMGDTIYVISVIRACHNVHRRMYLAVNDVFSRSRPRTLTGSSCL
jgi:hypothetical protein